MEQQSLFRIRDKRKKEWFFMDNNYLNGYAKFFGAVGTAVYVSLCRHSDSETQKCFPSIRLISEELSISKPTVIKYLKLFKKYKLIAVLKGNRNVKQQWQNNEYFLLDKSEWIKINNQQTQDPSKTVLHGFKETQVKPFSDPSKTDSETQVKPFNTNNTNIIRLIEQDSYSEQSSPSKDIVEVIEAFKVVNPSYKKYFGNKTQRVATQRLIKEHGKVKILSVIDFLTQSNKEKYAPIITTPLQLEDKFGALIAWSEKLKIKRKEFII